MRPRRFRSIPLLASLFALGVAPTSARADDDDRSRWFEGRTFEKKETFSLDGRSIECYVSKDDPKLWGWVIFPPGFEAPAMMDLAKRQAWTLKPAVLRAAK